MANYTVVKDSFATDKIIEIDVLGSKVNVRNPACSTREELVAFIEESVVPEMIFNLTGVDPRAAA